jgi:transmembrane sensor
VLQPGERIRVSAPAASVDAGVSGVDRPSIDQVLAWRRGEAIFLETSLSDAVAEMNRYSRTPIVLKGGARLSGARVSGQFRTGDNLAFAQALARLHGMSLSEGDGRLELALPN